VSRLRAVIAAKDEQVSVLQPRIGAALTRITALDAIRDALTRKALATATPRTRLTLVPQQITWALPPVTWALPPVTWALPPVTWALPPVSHQPVTYHHPIAEPPDQPARWHIEPAIAGSPAHRAGWI
jgi:hypothetical protein